MARSNAGTRRGPLLAFPTLPPGSHKRPEWAECEHCGGRYVRMRKGAAYCSLTCNSNASSIARRERLPKRGPCAGSQWEEEARAFRVERMARLLLEDDTLDWHGLALRFGLSDVDMDSWRKSVALALRRLAPPSP